MTPKKIFVNPQLGIPSSKTRLVLDGNQQSEPQLDNMMKTSDFESLSPK